MERIVCLKLFFNLLDNTLLEGVDKRPVINMAYAYDEH